MQVGIAVPEPPGSDDLKTNATRHVQESVAATVKRMYLPSSACVLTRDDPSTILTIYDSTRDDTGR